MRLQRRHWAGDSSGAATHRSCCRSRGHRLPCCRRRRRVCSRRALHRPGDRAPRPLAPPRKQGPSEGPPPDPEPKYSGESRPQGDRKRVGTSQNKCLPLPEPGRRHPFTLNFGRGCEISVLGAWSSVVRVRQTGTRRRQMDRKFKVNLELYSEYKTRLGYLRLSPREKRGRKE